MLYLASRVIRIFGYFVYRYIKMIVAGLIGITIVTLLLSVFIRFWDESIPVVMKAATEESWQQLEQDLDERYERSGDILETLTTTLGPSPASEQALSALQAINTESDMVDRVVSEQAFNSAMSAYMMQVESDAGSWSQPSVKESVLEWSKLSSTVTSSQELYNQMAAKYNQAIQAPLKSWLPVTFDWFMDNMPEFTEQK